MRVNILGGRLRGEEPEPFSAMLGLSKGRSYTPEASQEKVRVCILSGSGVFFMNGRREWYRPGHIFDIAPGVPHGFVKVQTSTVFIKSATRVDEADDLCELAQVAASG